MSIIESTVIDMAEAQVRTVEQARQMPQGTQAPQLRAAADDPGRYSRIDAVLRRLQRRRSTRPEPGPTLVVFLPAAWSRELEAAGKVRMMAGRSEGPCATASARGATPMS